MMSGHSLIFSRLACARIAAKQQSELEVVLAGLYQNPTGFYAEIPVVLENHTGFTTFTVELRTGITDTNRRAWNSTSRCFVAR